MNRIFIIISFIFTCLSGFAQNIPLYNWRSHIPYLQGMQVLEAGTRIYCATQTGLLYYDKSDNTMHTLSKVDGYSDVFVKTMAYAPHKDILFIAYQNGNMDIVHAGRITRHTDFENQLTINNIYVDSTETIAYFAVNSTNANNGIFEWRIDEENLYTSYNPNSLPNINRVTILRDSLYACSAYGVKKINLSVNFKTDPTQWESISSDSCTNIITYDGKVIGAFPNGVLKYYNPNSNNWVVLHRNQHHHHIQNIETGKSKMVMISTDSVYTYSSIPASLDSFGFQQGNDAIADVQGTIWMAQNTYVFLNYKNGSLGFLQPGGFPSTTIGNHAFGYHNQVWFSAGGFAANGAPDYDNHGFYMYDGQTWHNYNEQTNYGKDPSGSGNPGPDIRDFMGMAMDTVTGHLWIAAMDSGIMEFDPVSNSIINIYNARNTKNLKISPGSTSPSRLYMPVADVKFDQNDFLWDVNYNNNPTAKQQLTERTHNGSWSMIDAGPMTNVNALVIDNTGNSWLINSRGNYGVVIYNPTLKKITTLGTSAGVGGLPSLYINCGISDKNGEIWLGTTAGPCVFSDPSLLFGSSAYDVQRPYISTGGNAGYLLGALSVTAIAVDGANRKWFGTNDGVWLTSPEGDKIIQHFDITNSALVSNNINAIAINGISGEVFIATDKGIVSYRGDATDGGNKNQGVYAFPNPVRPGYTGPITISGLVTDADVKITDVTGTLVYETTANGGEATWNGKNFSGRDANSGVYLVFITNSDGSQTAMTKILIVR